MDFVGFGLLGGLWVIWYSSVVQKNDCVLNERHISTLFSGHVDGFKWCLTKVYGPICVDKKKQFFDELNVLTNFVNFPWCIGSDFNVIQWPSEFSVNPRISPCMRMFNSFIHNNKLLDVPSMGSLHLLNWLSNRSFIKLVEDFWQNTKIEGLVGHQFITKLKMPKNEISKWKKEY
ncbi:hypothetical protein AMTRI_Chr02g260400 [Amborella trichopoda]